MILLHIITEDLQQAKEIAEFLIEDRLIVDALITKCEKMTRDDLGKFITKNHVLIIGKTKALLFTTIDQKLRKKYVNRFPTLYSVPIVNMDWEQSKVLRKETKSV